MNLSELAHALNNKPCDFSFRTLANVNLTGQDLRDSNFEGAVLVDVNLTGADLTGANFTRTLLVDVTLDDATLDNTDFSCSSVWNYRNQPQGRRPGGPLAQ